jgi:hypothetical protein
MSNSRPGGSAHTWEFLAASGGGQTHFGPIVVAVCARCGRVRAEEVSRDAGAEDALDLSGACYLPDKVVS